MNFKENQFDIVVGSLILSVVPDADKCVREILRVITPNGKVIIFDKFTPKGKNLSPLKKAIRPFIKLLGTDIGVNFEILYENNKEVLSMEKDISIMFNGMYRKIIINKMNT